MDIDPELYKELLKTFYAEFKERIEVLTDSLLKLETLKKRKTKKNTEKIELIKVCFREAHNLKGTSRSLELEELGEIAHHLESTFAYFRDSERSIEQTDIDVCLQALDAMQAALKAFMADKEYDPKDIVEKLNQLTSGQLAQDNEEPPATSIEEISQAVAEASEQEDDAEQQDEVAENDDGDDDIEIDETITVSVDRINHLTAASDELQILKIRFEEYLRKFSEIENSLATLGLTQQAFTTRLHGDKEAVLSESVQDFITHIADNIHDCHDCSKSLFDQMQLSHRDLELTTDSIVKQARDMRHVPMKVILQNYPRIVRDISHQLNKEITLEIKGETIEIDRVILDKIKDPLNHIIRNAIDHGIETAEERIKQNKPEVATIMIEVAQQGSDINILVKDDGRGLNKEDIVENAIQKNIWTREEAAEKSDAEIFDLLFMSGFSTKKMITDISGRGVGLDVVRTNLQSIHGRTSLQSVLGQGTEFLLTIPATLLTDMGLLLEVGKQSFILPTANILKIVEIIANELIAVESGYALMFDGKPVLVQDLGEILKIKKNQQIEHNKLILILLSKGTDLVAYRVDKIIGENEVVIKPLKHPINHINNIAGAAVNRYGEIDLVLNSAELFNAAISSKKSVVLNINTELDEQENKPKILVVDDSMTTRTLEVNVLKMHGYDVETAIDGEDAWQVLQSSKIDLVITDVEMPRLNGFDLAERIKNDTRFESTPIIIVTTLATEEDRKRGVDVGADAYIVKSNFNSTDLKDLVARLLEVNLE